MSDNSEEQMTQEQRRLDVARIALLALQEIIDRRHTGRPAASFYELMKSYGSSVKITEEEARQALNTSLAEAFGVPGE